jgi:hypothetical protein
MERSKGGKFKIKISIAQIYMSIWSNTLFIKYFAYLITYLSRTT